MVRGVLGGTFNPVHLGHLRIAEAARRKLNLTEVLFVPAGEPWMKDGEELAPSEDRWEMVGLATAADPAFVPSRVDLDRPGPSYTIDTLRDLKREESGSCTDYFIMGMDTLLTVPGWKEPQAMLEICRLAVVTRPEHEMGEAAEAAASKLPGLMARTVFIEGVHVDISSTDIRLRVREGLPVTGLVPQPVEAYMKQHRLYQTTPVKKGKA